MAVAARGQRWCRKVGGCRWLCGGGGRWVGWVASARGGAAAALRGAVAAGGEVAAGGLGRASDGCCLGEGGCGRLRAFRGSSWATASVGEVAAARSGAAAAGGGQSEGGSCLGGIVCIWRGGG